MLRSDLLRLRPVQQGDLDELYRQFNDLAHRGPWFPMSLWSEPGFRNKFAEDGFWGQGEGMLLMLGAQGELTEYLFARERIERLQLNIHPANEASRKVAARSGYQLEGVMRQCWFNDGRFHDLEIWTRLRSDQPEVSRPDPARS